MRVSGRSVLKTQEKEKVLSAQAAGNWILLGFTR